MKLPALQEGRLLRRYKRFLADIEAGADAGYETFTAHCPNTGAMTGCAEPGWRVWYSLSDNPKRKYPATWELVETDRGLCSINTTRANHLVSEAIHAGVIGDLGDPQDLRAEVAIPEGDGRFDFALGNTFVEVKSVTLVGEDGQGRFPDAVSDRALKHVAALVRRVEAGDRAVLIFCAQHAGVTRIAPAADIDERYARALDDAQRRGVEIRGYGVTITPEEIGVTRELPFELATLS